MLTRGAEAVPRPGRGGSGGHQSRPAGCGRQEEISGILESTRGPAGRPPWEDCFRFSRCWFGVAEPWRRRSGPLPCPAPSAFAEKMRAAPGDATPPWPAGCCKSARKRQGCRVCGQNTRGRCAFCKTVGDGCWSGPRPTRPGGLTTARIPARQERERALRKGQPCRQTRNARRERTWETG